MCNNKILTAKYTVINFIPKNLLNQFKKLPNVYFLLICYLQTIPLISISGNKPAMALPLAVVVFVSMLKDAFEDYKRHQSDAQENNTESEVYDNTSKTFKKTYWKDIHVG
jgi:magnesium-transporting ATPase (P-type)